uniref:BLUF domain-containing protein n=1 Tax=Roseihalotalea indica TaxID=2867963 RepID=A0AA49GLG7_9BACT|nr:BLUF domain-containing protein [Tunicatimonas sp. TK19036]
MFALIYVSQAIHSFDEEDIYDLESHSCSKNKRLSVTGYLNYKKGKFLQYLEGEKEIVLDLMATIDQDDRHNVLRTIHLPDLEERRFKDCYMRYWTYNQLVQIKVDDMLETVLLRMSERIYGEDKLRNHVLRLVTRMAEVHKLHPQPVR